MKSKRRPLSHRGPITNTVIIGIGSNINPELNIRKAKQLLSNQCLLLTESKFIKTEPIGYKNQDDFINGAVMIATPWNRSQLKSTLKKIESRLGRNPSSHAYGPRTIDLDILVWNGKVVDRVFYTRDFIRRNVLELMPGLVNDAARPRRTVRKT